MTHKLTQVVIENVDLKQTRDHAQSRCVKTDHVNTCTAPPTRCGNQTEQLHRRTANFFRVSQTDRANTSAASLFTKTRRVMFFQEAYAARLFRREREMLFTRNSDEAAWEEGTNPSLKPGKRNSA